MKKEETQNSHKVRKPISAAGSRFDSPCCFWNVGRGLSTCGSQLHLLTRPARLSGEAGLQGPSWPGPTSASQFARPRGPPILSRARGSSHAKNGPNGRILQQPPRRRCHKLPAFSTLLLQDTGWWRHNSRPRQKFKAPLCESDGGTRAEFSALSSETTLSELSFVCIYRFGGWWLLLPRHCGHHAFQQRRDKEGQQALTVLSSCHLTVPALHKSASAIYREYCHAGRSSFCKITAEISQKIFIIVLSQTV